MTTPVRPRCLYFMNRHYVRRVPTHLRREAELLRLDTCPTRILQECKETHGVDKLDSVVQWLF
jgi:hypothetical protein